MSTVKEEPVGQRTVQNQGGHRLRALAVVAEPIHPDGPPLLTADPRWQDLARALAADRVPITVTLVRPPTCERLLEAVAIEQPDVVILDCAVSARGWLLEGEHGDREELAVAELTPDNGESILVAREVPAGDLDAVHQAGWTSSVLLGLPIFHGQSLERFPPAVSSILGRLAQGNSIHDAVTNSVVRWWAPHFRLVGRQKLRFPAAGAGERGARSGPTFTAVSPPGTPAPATDYLLADPRIVDLSRAVMRPDGRGAAVTGQIGSGKTELVRATVRRIGDRFAEGVIWISAPRELSAILEETARILRLFPDQRRLAHELRQRRTLLVVDDLDQLPAGERPEVRGFFEQIVSWSPTRLLFVTRSLPQDLDTLELEEVNLGTGLPREVFDRLLDFMMGEEGATSERNQVHRTARRFRGNPSAFQLAEASRATAPSSVLDSAVGWVADRLPPGLAARLGQGIEDRTEKLIQTALQRVSPEARLLLARIAIFPAAPAYEAVKRVCGEDIADLPERLEELRGGGLLEVEDLKLAVSPLIREATRQALSADDKASLERSLVRWSLDFVRRRGSDPQAVENQLPNLDAALELARSGDRFDPGDVVPLAHLIYRFQRQTGRFHEAAQALGVILDQPGIDPTEWAEERLALGHLYLEGSDFEGAACRLENLAGELEDQPDRVGLRIAALHGAAQALAALGELDGARSLLNKSLPLASAEGTRGALRLLLGTIELSADNLEQSQQHLDASRELLSRAHSVDGQGKALSALGDLSLVKGDPNGAYDYLQQAADLWRSIGNVEAEAAALQRLGRLLAEHDPARAAGLLEEARDLRLSTLSADGGWSRP